ncbi:matrixin family metalloprotease [Streptomyces sp. DSM 15324]|uniref:matrixin family metalloprotease n=1 Tax=Streptomyces sp. DSM 15324 TaxID=1739111 RepID=UPI001F3B9BE1|nr:matrixin family metalloprotease [Streptomyces sp. DSM 15324]
MSIKSCVMNRCSAAVLLAAALALLASGAGTHPRAGHPGHACVLAPGELTVDDLPAGSSATRCGAVGRLVTHGGAGLTVPEPGTEVSVDSLTADGSSRGFTLAVAADGTVSYGYDDGEDGGTGGHPADGEGDRSHAGARHRPSPKGARPPRLTGSRADAPAPCADTAYSVADRKEYGTYEWFIGDGPQPGDLPRRQVRQAFEDGITAIIRGRNACGLADTISARARFLAATGHEAGIDQMARCTFRDGMNVWDAGDLSSDSVATTCSWSRPVSRGPDRLIEADVRFNIHDYTFTDDPTEACEDAYDIRSVATHEAGHVFGLGHVGQGHENLTMFPSSFSCSTTARTLGKGDVLGLRSIY